MGIWHNIGSYYFPIMFINIGAITSFCNGCTSIIQSLCSLTHALIALFPAITKTSSMQTGEKLLAIMVDWIQHWILVRLPSKTIRTSSRSTSVYINPLILLWFCDRSDPCYSIRTHSGVSLSMNDARWNRCQIMYSCHSQNPPATSKIKSPFADIHNPVK